MNKLFRTIDRIVTWPERVGNRRSNALLAAQATHQVVGRVLRWDLLLVAAGHILDGDRVGR